MHNKIHYQSSGIQVLVQKTNKTCNITSPPALSGGLAIVMPTCAGWIWLSRGSTCRGLDAKSDLLKMVLSIEYTSCTQLIGYIGVFLTLSVHEWGLFKKWESTPKAFIFCF